VRFIPLNGDDGKSIERALHNALVPYSTEEGKAKLEVEKKRWFENNTLPPPPGGPPPFGVEMAQHLLNVFHHFSKKAAGQ
jgi:hypothetical protein